MIRVVSDVGGQEMVVMGEAGRLDPSQFIWVDLSAVCTSHNTVALAFGFGPLSSGLWALLSRLVTFFLTLATSADSQTAPGVT